VGGLSGGSTGWTGSPTELGTLGDRDAFVAKFTFNQQPTATDNSYTVVEGGTLNGNVITDDTGAGVDSDPDGDPLTASLVSGPLHGTLGLNADGSFTYTPFDEPASNFADADSFTYQVSDGKGGTDTATVSITVTPDATNEPPVNSVPGSQTTGQDIPLVFSEGNGNCILLRDDAGGNAIELTLTATNGTVTLAGTTGLSITGGADGSATVTVQGSLTDINNALEGLMFTPTASYLGAASLEVLTNDLGQSPAAAPQTDTDVIDIDVIAINDAPVNTVPGAQAVDQDGMLLFASATGTAISVSDPDAGSNAVEVTLTATNGTLNLPSRYRKRGNYGRGTRPEALADLRGRRRHHREQRHSLDHRR
jgi:VCBS repeat-containing protein